MFSFKSVVTSNAYVNMIQYLDALIVCESLQEKEELRCLDINIKWPNDVYVNRQTKFCGMLCQSSYHDGVFEVTSGIGINISNRRPTTCLEEQVALKTGKKIHLSR